MKSASPSAVVLLAFLLASFPPPPLLAHHSTAMFDMTMPFTVRGVVKRFEWTNPHAFIYLDVTDDKGQTQEWSIEMTSLNQLKTYGWVRDMVKPGDVISCTGGRAKNGMPTMLSSLMKLADGRMIKS